MTLKIGAITFDCHDAVVLSSFWSEALGRPVAEGAVPYFAQIEPNESGQAMLFIQVPEGKQTKNRMHLDLLTGDRHGEVARLLALGATAHGEHQEWGHTWTVMNDPEGNEFCIAEAHG